ncbi:hypothetical protein FQA47_003431 [Oryzias melastigma]|uniref:Uncharacterized protein n=1 Tax=Oryzias melastigma TaxID=30732 RepID=A0A834C3Q0_ORYME|nr:hypothetical protein FQA47_003431 [Oryzias melastigma]
MGPAADPRSCKTHLWRCKALEGRIRTDPPQLLRSSSGVRGSDCGGGGGRRASFWSEPGRAVLVRRAACVHALRRGRPELTGAEPTPPTSILSGLPRSAV